MSGTFPTSAADGAKEEAARNLALIVHGCYAAALLLGFTSIIGVVVAYMKRDETAGTIYESHLAYAIRTFWIGLAMGVVGLVLSFLLIGLPILIFAGVWYIIRVVRALLAWNERKPIDNPARFF